MPLLESGQMYLETIYVLSKKGSNVRSVDISEHMKYSKPSVCRAVGLLKKDGYITVDENGFIMLTDSGRQVAETIFERHTIITNVLISLGVDEETASEDACKIEHVISHESFDAIKKYLSDNK